MPDHVSMSAEVLVETAVDALRNGDVVFLLTFNYSDDTQLLDTQTFKAGKHNAHPALRMVVAEVQEVVMRYLWFTYGIQMSGRENSAE